MWFRRGKYPTEGQFADWLDSYVHKNESKILIVQVEELPEQLNNKYSATSGRELEREHNELKADYDAHKQSATQRFNNIADNIEELEAQNEQQQTEIDAANTNLEIARHRLHPTSNYAAMEEAFAALGENYNTLWGLANTLKTFLKAKDTADRTINRWQEIEDFLRGITDSETLSELLQQHRSAITDAYQAAIASAVREELERAVAAEQALQKKLDELRTRFESAETSLIQRIDDVKAISEKPISDLQQEVSLLKQEVADIREAMKTAVSDSSGYGDKIVM